MKWKQLGLTLVNLLVATTIIALLLATGIPALSALAAKLHANSTYYQWATLIHFARIQAVNYRSQVLVCPSSDSNQCTDHWADPIMVFVDSNSDEERNTDELILQTRPALQDSENIQWQASGSQRYLRFKPDGATGNQNGRFSYCLNKKGQTYAWQIIMYMTGRQRKGTEAEAKLQCG